VSVFSVSCAHAHVRTPVCAHTHTQTQRAKQGDGNSLYFILVFTLELWLDTRHSREPVCCISAVWLKIMTDCF